MGISLIEVLIAIGIVGLLLALLTPALQSARESGRRAQCLANLRQLGLALQQYHDSHARLPAAVTWAPAGEPLGGGFAPPGTIDRVSLGLSPAPQPDRLYANWLIALLPFTEQQTLHSRFDLRRPLADPANQTARATEVALLKCPSDAANGPNNPFRRGGVGYPEQHYARGNYALNGGTNRRCLMQLSNMWPPGSCTDGFQANGTNLLTDTSQVWGSGIAGVNKWFRFADFPNGLSKTVAVEEIRAGVHPLDRRGVWSLGFPGSSTTIAHGMSGNRGPNAGADSIQGCGDVLDAVPDLAAQGMPCTRAPDASEDISQQATARSMHSGGVNLLMADGSAHFVDNAIDAHIWQQMHKRDNQMAFELPF